LGPEAEKKTREWIVMAISHLLFRVLNNQEFRLQGTATMGQF
jgi:hypothetical protein